MARDLRVEKSDSFYICNGVFDDDDGGLLTEKFPPKKMRFLFSTFTPTHSISFRN